MASTHPYNQVILFGDSITQFSFDPDLRGYGCLLANAYVRKMDVLNRGFSGYNTDWAIPILNQLLPTVKEQEKEDCSIPLMTIFFGANDAAIPSTGQHVPLDRYESNVKKMIDMIKNPESKFYNPKMRLILITPPPLNEMQWKKHCENQGTELNRFNKLAKSYAECVVKIGKETDIPVADIWAHLMDKAEGTMEKLEEYLIDGLHLNSNGYRELYNILIDIIAKKYEDIHPDNLKYEIGWWRDIVKETPVNVQFPLLKNRRYD